MRGIFKSIAALTFACLIVAFTPHTTVDGQPSQTKAESAIGFLAAHPTGRI